MTSVKGLLKKAFTLDGVIKIIVIMFVMNLTIFGRSIMDKIKGLFRRGMRGI